MLFILVTVSMCYQAIAQWKTKGDGHCAICVENECKETFARRSAKFTGPLVSFSKRAFRGIAVDSDSRVHLKQTAALFNRINYERVM